MTRRQGRPYTLVLKTDALSTCEEDARARDGADLAAHGHADGGIDNDSRSLGFQLRRARNFMIGVT